MILRKIFLITFFQDINNKVILMKLNLKECLISNSPLQTIFHQELNSLKQAADHQK